MWKSALAGALALAATGISLATTTAHADDVRMVSQQEQHGTRLLSEAKIRRFKAALKLNPHQERHWPAVAAELRRLRRTARGHSGYVHGLVNGARDISSDVVGLRRVVSAAMPLFATLDSNQKGVALRIVTAMGFGSFVAAL